MRKLNWLLILLLVVFVLPVAAQDEGEWMPTDLHTECEVDLTGETITLWHLGDLSGPYAPITQPLLAGFDDAAAWFNANGGLCGAEIAFPDATTIDTGGDQELASTIYSRVSDEDPVMLVLYSSDDSELLRSRVAEDEIPVLISAGSIEGLYGGEADNFNAPGWVFATNPLYVDQLGFFCDYAGENIENPVIGYISWPTAFGRAAFTPEAIEYCASVGVTMLAEPEYFAPGSDISGQVQNLVDNGANILYTNSLATGPAEIAATVTNLGLSNQVTLAGVNWVLDTSVGFLGQNVIDANGLPAVNGILGSMPFYWWTETDQPGIAFIVEQADLNERSALTRNIAYLLGWLTVDAFIETYIQTANRVGAENVDGPAIKETLEMLNYNAMGLLLMDFRGGELRDVYLNRIAELRYLGQDGTPAVLPDNPPMVVEGESGPVLVPIVVPLTDFGEVPDLRPGMMGMDDMSEEG